MTLKLYAFLIETVANNTPNKWRLSHSFYASDDDFLADNPEVKKGHYMALDSTAITVSVMPV